MLAIIVSLSVVMMVGMGFATALTQSPGGYDSYRHALCIGKVLELARNGIVRDAGGYDGAISECIHVQRGTSIFMEEIYFIINSIITYTTF